MRYDRNVVAGTKQINAELEKIQDSIDTMLDREGTAPNELLSSIDMNNFRIYNLADPASELDAVNKKYLDQVLVSIGAQSVIPIALSRVSGDGVTTEFTVLNSGVSDASSYFVFLDGVQQKPNVDYTVSGTTLTFIEAPSDSVYIDITYFEPRTSDSPLSLVQYDDIASAPPLDTEQRGLAFNNATGRPMFWDGGVWSDL